MKSLMLIQEFFSQKKKKKKEKLNAFKLGSPTPVPKPPISFISSL